MVRVGSAAAPLVNWEPSETNRSRTSWARPQWSTTPSSGRSLIRQVPRLWVEGCGAVRYVPTAPTARYSVSAAGAEDRPRADQHSAGSGDPSPRAGDPGDDHRPRRDGDRKSVGEGNQ